MFFSFHDQILKNFLGMFPKRKIMVNNITNVGSHEKFMETSKKALYCVI